jgi:hypothetical protein
MDGHAHGTWLATGADSRTVCLLNGAFEKHSHRPPYRKSRGIVLLESFEFETTEQFAREYDFDGIEPFTLVVFDNDQKLQISEVRWDEQNAHHSLIDTIHPHIWSSATLYSKEVREKREAWFKDWLQEHDTYDAKDIRDFHHFGGEGNSRIDFKMNWDDKVQTVSITSMEINAQGAQLYYEDLLQGEDAEVSIKTEA